MTLPPHVRAEPWLTTRELADRLNVSPRTIQRLDLPRLRVGGQNRYLMSEVLRELRGAPAEVVPLRREAA